MLHARTFHQFIINPNQTCLTPLKQSANKYWQRLQPTSFIKLYLDLHSSINSQQHVIIPLVPFRTKMPLDWPSSLQGSRPNFKGKYLEKVIILRFSLELYNWGQLFVLGSFVDTAPAAPSIKGNITMLLHPTSAARDHFINKTTELLVWSRAASSSSSLHHRLC